MFGRATEIKGSPEKVEEGIKRLRDHVLPAIKEAGSAGFLAFADRESGRLLGISLWSSREAMDEARERVANLRGDVASTVGGEVGGVTEYEVVLDERF